jgi:hypothetical protein
MFYVSGDPDFPAEKYVYERDEISFGPQIPSVSSHIAAVDLNDIYVSVVRLDLYTLHVFMYLCHG